ncbi:hypothetical protein [uncultured Cytophaga sp.]|uniref:hypothetical protein n=1 Tax=uncultured Cytophaga sp. TaxID=160238 RepID=UPI002624C92B|nr:hypothetical protein [uncultured Cytophaga sp.]
MKEQKLRKKIKSYILFFMIGLILSGITAFPIETQLEIAVNHIDVFPLFIQSWLLNVYTAVKSTNDAYPFISYGTDWLAFAHIVIAVVFIGPYKDPVKNIWVIQFGMIACAMIFPLAFIAGPIRHIPFYWQLIDCSFGVIGFLLLYRCYRYIKQLEIISSTNVL